MLINEIFHSLQGEGYHAGTPAVFVRFAGCNLGCPFCDTDHSAGTDMTTDEIVAEVGRYPARLVVLTGGEPALQLTDDLVDALHRAGKRVAVETNGTCRLPKSIDWITLSPKDAFVGPSAAPVLRRADEIKVVFDGQHEPCSYPGIEAAHRFVQPCDTGDARRNAELTRQAVDFCLANPDWRLSLQIHKILKIK